MNYSEFKNKVLNLPYITSKDLTIFKDNKQIIRNQLTRWENKGLIIKLKRGVYLLNENDRKINPSRTFLANQLYSPSYVSLEYALNFYDLIPERVFDITSVTTRKTRTITNKLGEFVYRKIKADAYRGFQSLNDEAGLEYFIAFPEKAIVDFFFLNMGKFEKIEKDIFTSSFRFQNVDILNEAKLLRFVELFKNKKLERIIKVFVNFIKGK